jgi:hypothetical protein
MATQPAPAKVEPLTADLRRLHMTVSKRFMQKLEAARDALSHGEEGWGEGVTAASPSPWPSPSVMEREGAEAIH